MELVRSRTSLPTKFPNLTCSVVQSNLIEETLTLEKNDCLSGPCQYSRCSILDQLRTLQGTSRTT